VLGCLLATTAGYLGLMASWVASVDYGLRLTSASAVVLVLVAGYLLALPAVVLRRWRRRLTAAPGASDVAGSLAAVQPATGDQ
jgi:manganese/iron transport system permease protein